MIESDLARIADALDRISAIMYSYVSCHVPTRVATSWSKPEPDKDPEGPPIVIERAPDSPPAKTRSSRSRAKPEPTSEPLPEPAPESHPEPTPEPAVELTADGMRSRMRALAALAPGNRDRLLEAMGTFGASNFSKLDPTDYPALSRLLDTIEEDSKP